MVRVKHVKLPEPPELGYLKPESLTALRNLAKYVPDPEPCPEAIPAFRRAAVLLGVFGGRRGDLYVILSKRASALRSHGGDTAIPGGRFEPSDADMEATAVSATQGDSGMRTESQEGLEINERLRLPARDVHRLEAMQPPRHGGTPSASRSLTHVPSANVQRREAWEETGLPIDPKRAVKLCELRPFLSANELVVTPIVVLLVDPLIKPSLNPDEVDSLFSLPLLSFLEHSPHQEMRLALRLGAEPSEEMLQDMPKNEVSGPSDWHTCRDVIWFNHRIRRHTFWDVRNPVRGLTADILIDAARIGYERPPSFQDQCPGQPSQNDLIKMAFTGPMAIRKRRVRPRMFSEVRQPQEDLSEEHGSPNDSTEQSAIDVPPRPKL